MPNTFELNNVFRVETAFDLTSNAVTHNIAAGLYGIILSPDGSHSVLVPVETVETSIGSGIFTNIVVDGATNHYSNIAPSDIATNSANFVEASTEGNSVPPSYFPQNIVNVSVPTDFTNPFTSETINIASGTYALLPNGDGKFGLFQVESLNGGYEIKDGGIIVSGFTHGDVFDVGLTSNSNITALPDGTGPKFPAGDYYEVQTFYKQSTQEEGGGVGVDANNAKVASGIDFKVQKVSVDIFGVRTVEDVTANLDALGLTVSFKNLTQDADITVNGGDLSYSALGTSDGDKIEIRVSDSDGSSSNAEVITETNPQDYMVFSQRTDQMDNPFTAVNESKSFFVEAIDMWTGSQATLTSDLKLSFYDTNALSHIHI